MAEAWAVAAAATVVKNMSLPRCIQTYEKTSGTDVLEGNRVAVDEGVPVTHSAGVRVETRTDLEASQLNQMNNYNNRIVCRRVPRQDKWVDKIRLARIPRAKKAPERNTESATIFADSLIALDTWEGAASSWMSLITISDRVGLTAANGSLNTR